MFSPFLLPLYKHPRRSGSPFVLPRASGVLCLDTSPGVLPVNLDPQVAFVIPVSLSPSPVFVRPDWLGLYLSFILGRLASRGVGALCLPRRLPAASELQAASESPSLFSMVFSLFSGFPSGLVLSLSVS